jgi:hypothetical protein
VATAAASAGALRAVLAVDVLDHLLAAFVLEVHVDVRRLAALAADEALEQQRGLRRVHLGDAQAVAHRRIGRRAAALAEDALAAGEVHHVVDRQEEGLVAHLGHQRQLVFDLGPHGGRHALRVAVRRVAPLRAGQRLVAQPAGGAVPGRNDLLRVLVAQFIQAEAAALGQAQRLVQPGAAVHLGQRQPGAQVLLGVVWQQRAAVGQRGAVADGGERVQQRLARAHMHAHVAHRHDGDTAGRAGRAQPLAAQAVVGMEEQRQRQPGAFAEGGRHPVRLGPQRGCVVLFARDQQGPAAGHAAQVLPGRVAVGIRGGGSRVQVVHAEPVRPLGAAAARQRDQLAQVAVALPMAGDQHQPAARRVLRIGAGLQHEVRTDQQLQRVAGLALALGLLVCAHHAGQRALVGDCQRGVAQLGGAGHQLLGVRGAVQEAEVAAADQLGIGRQAPGMAAVGGVAAGARLGSDAVGQQHAGLAHAGQRWRGHRLPGGLRAFGHGESSRAVQPPAQPNRPCRNQRGAAPSACSRLPWRSRKIHHSRPSSPRATW